MDAAQAHRDAIHSRVTAVEAAMTPDQREAFLGLFVRLNPHLGGIHVADAIDMLYDCDGHLDITEPLHDEHGTDPTVLAAPAGLLSMCTYAVLYACGRLQGPGAFRERYWPEIEALMVKATEVMQRGAGH